MSDADYAKQPEPLVPQRYAGKSKRSERRYRNQPQEKRKVGRPFKAGKPAKYEPTEFRAWFVRLLCSLRDTRLELDISTKALGAAIHMHPTSITQFELGRKRDMRLSTLFRLARGMGIDVHEVVP